MRVPVASGAGTVAGLVAAPSRSFEEQRLSHALSLTLGVVFVVLAVAAVILQAWLWNPKYWDPVAKKSNAPPTWMRVHRIVGYAYALIYFVMMWHMVPRLWGYAIELPARTVAHAIAAIIIGCVLSTKIAILRWFRHFEEAMPALGMVLLVSTVVLVALSLPFGIRAYAGVDLDEDARARVDRVLSSIETETPIDAHTLSAPDSLAHGRAVLTTQCTQCHDLRTILAEPRTGPRWHTLVVRMAAKPTLGLTIGEADEWALTAYLISITPTLQQASATRYDELVRDRAAVEAAEPAEPPDAGSVPDDAAARTADAELVSDAATSDAATSDAGVRARRPHRPRPDASGVDAGVIVVAAALGREPTPPAPVPPPAPASEPALVYSASLGRQLLTERCEDCHASDELDEHGGDDRVGWSGVVRRMIARGATLTADEARVLATYLASARPLP